MKEELHIAYLQQEIAWEDPDQNYQLVEESFARAIDKSGIQPDILVAPETFNTGFSNNISALAESDEGPTFQFAQRIAKQYDALFVASWAVRDYTGIHNRMHWVDGDGNGLYYDKAHTFRMSSEGSQVERGTQKKIFRWRGWRIRPVVCYDLRFPNWLRNKRLDPTKVAPSYPPEPVPPLTYDLMIVCANWPASRIHAWNTLLQARAIENMAFVVGCNCVGVDGLGIEYSGHSAIYDYEGKPLSSCQPGEATATIATLRYADLQHYRNRYPFYIDFD